MWHVVCIGKPMKLSLLALIGSLLTVAACGGADPSESDAPTDQAEADLRSAVKCHTVGGTSHPNITLSLSVSGRTMRVGGTTLKSGGETVKLVPFEYPTSGDDYLHFSAEGKNAYEFAYPKARVGGAGRGIFTIGVGIATYDVLLNGPRDYYEHYSFECAGR
jgi:hypothetical protein